VHGLVHGPEQESSAGSRAARAVGCPEPTPAVVHESCPADGGNDVAIARALAVNPRLLMADGSGQRVGCVSQAQILNLFAALSRDRDSR
jgi:ABC-type dipeptide/oligopeptide/nickel transport system ATPase component